MLKDLYKELIFNSFKGVDDSTSLEFLGTKYHLRSSDDIGKLTDKIKSTINDTEMMKSDWYKVVKKLKEVQLIRPCGVMLAAGTPSDKQLAYYDFDYYARLIKKDGDPIGINMSLHQTISGVFHRSGLPYRDKDFGQQLANYSRHTGKLSCILPLVSETSKIRTGGNYADSVTNIYFINEFGNDINTKPVFKEIIDNIVRFVDGESRYADSVNPPQSIYIRNKNKKEEPAYVVYGNNKNSFCVTSDHKDWEEPLNDCLFFNDTTSHNFGSYYTRKNLDCYLIPINDYIMKSFNNSSDKTIKMNLFYSSGNNLPQKIYKQFFG